MTTVSRFEEGSMNSAATGLAPQRASRQSKRQRIPSNLKKGEEHSQEWLCHT
jgi:hypothetical protein